LRPCAFSATAVDLSFCRSVTRSDAQAHAIRDQLLRQFDIAGLQSGLEVEGSNGNLVVD
jgi:hypothetical protein